ncbi:plasma membrane localization protein, partial [Basidiobolus ranarum]
FSLFCSNYDGSSLGIDSELSSLLENLLTKYSDWCLCPDTSLRSTKTMRILGLTALSSFITSPSGKSSFTKKHLSIILPSFLCNINNIKLDVEYLKFENNAKFMNLKPRDSHSIHSTDTLNEDLSELALSCLKGLMNSTNAANISLISKQLFRYLDETNFWNHQECAVEIIHFILNNMEPRYRFMVVNEIVKRIDTEYLTPKKHTLTKLLISLLLNYMVTPGISVLELLGVLIDYFSDSLKFASINLNPTTSFNSVEADLTKAIGALTTNIYYVGQVTDIMSYILGKMRIGEKRAEIDGIPAPLFRLKMLQCLISVVSNNKATATDNSIVSRTTFRVVALALPLLNNESIKIRKACGIFLTTCLENENIGASHIPVRKLTINSRLVRRNSNPDLKFRNSVHKALIDCVTGKAALPIDFAIVFSIFKQMLERYVFDELVLAIPVMFKLQKYNESNVDADFAVRILLDQLVDLYILHLGLLLNIPEIIQQAECFIEQRKLVNQWCPLFGCNDQDNFIQLEGQSLDDINKDDLKSEDYQSIPLSFQEILHILNHRVELKKRFTELEKRLTAENLILATDDSKKLISRTITSTSRVMHGLIPKFTFPTLHKSENKTSGTHKPVKFETLKEALRLSRDSISEHETDASDKRTLSQTTHSKKSQKSSRSDMSLLLKTISSGSSSGSPSLVNTPSLSTASHS